MNQKQFEKYKVEFDHRLTKKTRKMTYDELLVRRDAMVRSLAEGDSTGLARRKSGITCTSSGEAVFEMLMKFNDVKLLYTRRARENHNRVRDIRSSHLIAK